MRPMCVRSSASRRLVPTLSKSLVAAALAAGAALVVGARLTPGAVVVEAAGTSAAGNPVAFRATFSLAADELTLDLENISPVPTSDPADVLSSFYFDVERNGTRPKLDYLSAAGQVFEVRRKAADRPVIYAPPATPGGTASIITGFGPSALAARKGGDLTWQFRRLDPGFDSLAGFGLGTVGNSKLSPAGFDPAVVGHNDFAIYRGEDIEPKGNLPDKFLARELVRFRFGGAGDLVAADIGHRFTFGLGTSPDSTIVVIVPEPARGLAFAAGSAVATLLPWRRRQAARRLAQAAGRVSAAGGGPAPWASPPSSA